MCKALRREGCTSTLGLGQIRAVDNGEQTGSSKSGQWVAILEVRMDKATACCELLGLQTPGLFAGDLLSSRSTTGEGVEVLTSRFQVHKTESGVYPRIALSSAGVGRSHPER